MEVIISIVALIAGIAIAIVVYCVMRQQLVRVQEQLTKTEQNLSIEQEKCKNKEIEVAAKTAELTFERKANEEARKQADEKLAEQIRFLQTELTNTTQKLLDIRSEKLEQTNKTQMSSIIDPLKETISKLEKEMKDTQVQHGNTTIRLEQSIKNLVEKTENIGARADRLVETLLYQPKSQGDWGELIVKEMLESQGLKEGIHYVYQPTLRDEKSQTLRNEETNKIMRPDFILHLDEKEDVIIDSKMTITSYDNYVHAKTDEERELHAKEILASIHNHISELKRANYSAYIDNGRRSADFVFMFIPNEGAMQVALAHEKNLWRDTFLKDRIFIVSEMNLYAALRIISITWRQIEQNKSYTKIFQTVSLLLDRLNGFIEKFGKIEKGLQQASKAYDEANHQLLISSQSVLQTGKRLNEMGVKTKKALPGISMEDTSNDNNDLEELLSN
ncbi:MAG: DNA recombination protein RmuC [Paludibacteraceae bacterium]|nr:DNA recombination protein RmuC [Paludibacteraceae bacterium]